MLFSDLAGFQTPHGGTIPPRVLVTALRPDLVILNELSREIIIFELTCPWDSHTDRSHSKYAALIADLSWSSNAFLFSIEVSMCGQLTKANRSHLKAVAFRCCDDLKVVTKSLIGNL